MEKNKSGRIIAVIALVVAVLGLSLGFAAYSSYLRIEGTATVQSSNDNWKVGFSIDGTNIEALNGTETKNGTNTTTGHTSDGGSITVSRYSISQATNPVLATTEGSSVSYSLSVLNKGSIDANLSSVTFAQYPVTCAYATTSGSEWVESENNTQQPYAGTTKSASSAQISDADCNAMFGVTLSINNNDYTSTATGTGALAKKTGNHPVQLTLAYKNDAAAQAAAANLSGDVVVTIQPIGIVYTSAQ